MRVPPNPDDPEMRAAIATLEELILAQFPDATFDVAIGEDPTGVYLTVTVDTDDLTEILDVVDEVLVDFEIEKGPPLYLAPTRPIERTLADLKEAKNQYRERWLIPDEPSETRSGSNAS
jgi:hypothetical protein